MDRPYLRPVYDEPEFVVRNIWRQYGGWWDGNPSTLKPAPEAALATQIADLAGGPGVLADRALALAAAVEVEDGVSKDPDLPVELRLAAHLVELAALAAPSDPGVHRTPERGLRPLRQRATSTMAKGVFTWAARSSESAVGDAG